MLGWRVWYADGSVYDSSQHAWEALPDDGLIVKMIYYSNGYKQIQQGHDYFYEAPHHSGEIIRGFGMERDRIPERYPGAIIKRGQWVPDKFYRKIVDQAMSSVWDK